MRRAIITIAATITGVVLLLGFKTHPLPQAAPASLVPPTAESGPPASAPAAPSDPATGSSTTSAGPASGTRTLTGTAVDTRYGPVQVQVTVSGTKITDVTAIQVPAESGRDQQINSYAVPQLTAEVLAAQSAHVDMVSGGTYTSEGYLTSLQSVLDQLGIQ